MAKKENRHAELVSASANIEAPYELPEGWKWCRLGDVAKFIGGGTPDKSNSSYWNGKIPWASVKDIKGDFLFSTEDFITELGLHESSASLCDENGLILVTRISPGKSIISKIKTAINQDLKIIETEEFKPFLKYFFDFYEEEIKLLSSGTTVKGIKLDVLNSLPFPLPPTLAEQQRIVNLIETMFAKLDQAQEKAQAVLDSFETRKAAILHKAFTGELKIDNEELTIEDWEEKKLGEVCESIFDGDHMPPPKSESGIPFLVISNVNTGYLSFDNTRYVPSDYYDSLSETRKPKKGDVLYTIVGSYGIPVLVDSDRAFCFQRHMALLKPSKLISSRYLWYVLQSNDMYQKATSIATGTAQLTVPIKGLRELTIPVPPLNYQLSIVNFLDTVLEKESSAKEAAQTVLDQIALLKKSILARAFRGKI